VPDFLGPDFLLDVEPSRRLYHEYAEGRPIFDFHCHLSPRAIAEDHTFGTITEVWLGGDHYKWRAMRTLGVDEELITGGASDWEKFRAWAESVPYTVRNPLYHWTHMELRKPFGITKLLDADSAREIYERCNEALKDKSYSARGLLSAFDVRVICTSDDPTDDLAYHARLIKDYTPDSDAILMLPTFRADTALALDDGEAFNRWADRLGQAANVETGNLQGFLDALSDRHRAFHDLGCRAADYGIEEVYSQECTEAEAKHYFAGLRRARRGTGHLGLPERTKLKSWILRHLCELHGEAGWVQQFHIGALRQNNSRMEARLGPATGYDGMGDWEHARSLVRLLDGLDSSGRLAKTIVFALNPRDYEMLAANIGSFQEGPFRGKMQLGTAWWFNDHELGMEDQINVLSNVGILASFVGMVTDSRSFLSFPRHDYFRRILCNVIGKDVHSGRLPTDYDTLGSIVRDICYNNAVRYFGAGPHPGAG
jgi:glucuronate isomerase